MNKKTCKTCKQPKPVTAFYNRSDTNGDGLQGTCKECMKECKKRYRSDPKKWAKELAGRRRSRRLNPEHFRGLDRVRNLRYAFGIDEREYQRLLTIQKGVCAICGKPESALLKGKTKRLAVDHCEATKLIRGLLCSRCNTAIGLLQHDPDIIGKALWFILKPATIRIWK